MSGVLIALELVLILPLFIGTWRASLLGLSLQGFLIARLAFAHGFHVSPDSIAELVDLVFVRAIGAPLALYVVLRRQNAPRRNDVIAPNLLSWALALALVLIAFRVADVLVPTGGDPQAIVAVSASALLLGLLVLATQTGAFSQMIGAFRVENAIALFELGDAHHSSLGVRVGQTTLLVGTVALFRGYLVHLNRGVEASPPPETPAL